MGCTQAKEVSKPSELNFDSVESHNFERKTTEPQENFKVTPQEKRTNASYIFSVHPDLIEEWD